MALIREHYEAMELDRKKLCRNKFCKLFGVDTRTFYKIVQGKKKFISQEEAYFFAEYFDLDKDDLLDTAFKEKVEKLTKVTEKDPEFNNKPVGLDLIKN